MRIALVSTYPATPDQKNKTGVEWYTELLVSHLPLSEADSVDVLCQRTYGEPSYKRLNPTTSIHRLYERNLSVFLKILLHLYRHRPQIVHIQHEQFLYGNILSSYLFLMFLLLLYPFKTVTTIHGVVSLDYVTTEFVKENRSRFPVPLVKIGFFILFYFIGKLSKHIIVHEEKFKLILAKEYKVAVNKVTVCPIGVEHSPVYDKASARTILNLPVGKRIIFFVGYFTGYKGLNLLVKNFVTALHTDPNLYLLVGSGMHPKHSLDASYGYEYEEFRANTVESIGSANCRWDGFVPEESMATYMSAVDLVVFPYTVQMSSSGPMSIALAYRVPFIASEAFSSVLSDEVIFRNTPEAFSTKLQEFFQDPTSINKYVNTLANSRSWEVVGRRTFDVYSLLNERNK